MPLFCQLFPLVNIYLSSPTQKLCGVLDISQTEFNWEFCHAEFNNSLSFRVLLKVLFLDSCQYLPLDCPKQASGGGGKGGGHGTPLLLKGKLGN